MRSGDMRSLLQLYRGTEATGTLQSRKASWGPQAQAWGGFLPAFLTLRSYGAGEVGAGTREVHVHPNIDVTERDGVQVTAGPEAGTRWRVVDVDRGDPALWRLRLEPFTGSFA
jgi:hypothetical protein